MPQDRWNERSGPGRVSPRELINNAQQDLNKAWGETEGDKGLYWIRSSVDWIRRALEQMVPEPEPLGDDVCRVCRHHKSNHGVVDNMSNFGCAVPGCACLKQYG